MYKVTVIKVQDLVPRSLPRDRRSKAGFAEVLSIGKILCLSPGGKGHRRQGEKEES